MSSIFTATFSAVAVTAAQDCFEIVAGSNTRVRILDVKLAQYTDFGDTAAEILSVQVIRGFTTSGSGGSTATPVNLQPWSRAATSTVEINNTTVAQDGTGAVIVADGWNIAAGWSLRDSLMVPEGRGIWLEKSTRLVVRITAPADSLTVNGTLVFEEAGMAPA
jgi:hypothetical protein